MHSSGSAIRRTWSCTNWRTFCMWDSHVHSHVHPCELFCQGWGEPHGFAFSSDHDLPDSFFAQPDKMSAEILVALASSKMFPDGSRQQNQVLEFSNGHAALHSIITADHPRFIAVPIKQVLHFPVWQNMSASAVCTPRSAAKCEV